MKKYSFVVCAKFEEIKFSQDQLISLNKPSGLKEVRLITHYWDNEYETVDFTGTTQQEAIIQILAFYNNQIIRDNIGDHVFYEGFYSENGIMTISLGS